MFSLIGKIILCWVRRGETMPWRGFPNWDLLEQTKRAARRGGVYCSNCEQIVELRDGRCTICNSEISQKSQAKNKVIAIILNVVFGIFGWLYTFKIDGWKILVNMAIIFFIDPRWLFVGWVWAICEAILRKPEFYKHHFFVTDQGPLRLMINFATMLTLGVFFIFILVVMGQYLLYLIFY
ncbi:hypothetical protein [Natranaerobius thermophilus]